GSFLELYRSKDHQSLTDWKTWIYSMWFTLSGVQLYGNVQSSGTIFGIVSRWDIFTFLNLTKRQPWTSIRFCVIPAYYHISGKESRLRMILKSCSLVRSPGMLLTIE